MSYRCIMFLVTTLIAGVCCVCSAAAEEQFSSYTHYSHSSVSHQNHSSYRVPDWVYSKPPVLKRMPNYGRRRFLTFPNGSVFNVTLKFGMPVRGIGSISILGIEHVIVFRLPTPSSSYAFGRSVPAVNDRRDFYGYFASFLRGFGLDGHACVLRAICEVAEMPFDHGLLGEAINHVLSMIAFCDSSASEDEYQRAEHQGRHHGNCGVLYPGCRLSVPDLVSYVI